MIVLGCCDLSFLVLIKFFFSYCNDLKYILVILKSDCDFEMLLIQLLNFLKMSILKVHQLFILLNKQIYVYHNVY